MGEGLELVLEVQELSLVCDETSLELELCDDHDHDHGHDHDHDLVLVRGGDGGGDDETAQEWEPSLGRDGDETSLEGELQPIEAIKSIKLDKSKSTTRKNCMQKR